MTIQELIEMLKAIRDKRPFKVNYRLLKDGKLNRFYEENYGEPLIEFLVEISSSEPPTYEKEDNK